MINNETESPSGRHQPSLPPFFSLLAVSLVFAGMFAIRADHDFVVQEDFMKAVRKVADSKKLESKLDYKPV